MQAQIIQMFVNERHIISICTFSVSAFRVMSWLTSPHFSVPDDLVQGFRINLPVDFQEIFRMVVCVYDRLQ